MKSETWITESDIRIGMLTLVRQSAERSPTSFSIRQLHRLRYFSQARALLAEQLQQPSQDKCWSKLSLVGLSLSYLREGRELGEVAELGVEEEESKEALALPTFDEGRSHCRIMSLWLLCPPHLDRVHRYLCNLMWRCFLQVKYGFHGRYRKASLLDG